jgi:hypothetical protein
MISITSGELKELEKKQDWSEHVLNNLLCICGGGKPVACLAARAP